MEIVKVCRITSHIKLNIIYIYIYIYVKLKIPAEVVQKVKIEKNESFCLSLNNFCKSEK